MLKPEPGRLGTQHLPSCPVDVNVSKNQVWSFIVRLLVLCVGTSAIGRSVVCDCCISLSNPLAFLMVIIVLLVNDLLRRQN